MDRLCTIAAFRILLAVALEDAASACDAFAKGSALGLAKLCRDTLRDLGAVA